MTMNMLSNMKIGKRLAVSYGALTLMMLIMMGVSIWAQGTSNDLSEGAMQTQRRGNLASGVDKNVSLTSDVKWPQCCSFWTNPRKKSGSKCCKPHVSATKNAGGAQGAQPNSTGTAFASWH
jgi:hypothetical protein